MPSFAIRNPYFIIVVCLVVMVVGVTAVARMPVDLFPSMNIPVVVVATFYSGMPPEQIETDITSRFERFFTLASGVEHIESRSLTGVSIIRVYFQPGSNPDSAVTSISNLAMANLRRLPPGTLPPVVLKFDASSLPVCLVTFQGEGLTETQLRDQAQLNIRNQLASVPGASVPQPFGGVLRQIMIYADPLKLEAYQLSLMDVVRSVNQANLILPAGDVKIGHTDYNIYTNSQLPDLEEINALPIKIAGTHPVHIRDIGEARDSHLVQTNVVRVNGQRSVYLPVMKQGGDSNTIAVVDGVRQALGRLTDIPDSMKTSLVFDQSEFVKTSIETLIHEGGLGLLLTSVMILVFLGDMRATVAVFFSIPLSTLATFIALNFAGSSINSMVLGGLALAFSRLIDNSVVVLENIFRHLEMGEDRKTAALKGGTEVALPVLAATLTTAIVFFPVTFLFGVSKFLFSALALAVVLALLASYVVALTVVPLFASRFLKPPAHGDAPPAHAGEIGPAKAPSLWHRAQGRFNAGFAALQQRYAGWVNVTLQRPGWTLTAIGIVFAGTLLLFPALDMAFFPSTDAGQFVVNLKAPSGTRIEETERQIARVESIVREVIPAEDLNIIVSNLGTTPDFSAIFSSNAAPHTAFVQVSLKEEHKVGTPVYMERVRQRILQQLPQLTPYFQTGGIVDAVLNMGMPAPIDVEVSGSNMEAAFETAVSLAKKVRQLPDAAEIFIPQDLDYPSIRLDVDRLRAGEMGLTQQEVVQNVITALTSNAMIAPSFWIDPRTGYDYMLTVQYGEHQIRNFSDLKAIPLRAPSYRQPTRLDMISGLTQFESPTEVDHYQLRRKIDIYVRPRGEDLNRLARGIDQLMAQQEVPKGVRITLRGMVNGMRESFTSFGLGLILAVVLLYLVLVAQFRSFTDATLILTAIPPGISGVILILLATNTSLNVMSLMGVVMMAGIAVSNSILIVEFTRTLRDQGMAVREAVVTACQVRLRPVMMTTFATVIALIPMAMKLGRGSEAYAPLARALLGGLSFSFVLTIFIIPAAYLLVHGRKDNTAIPAQPEAAR